MEGFVQTFDNREIAMGVWLLVLIMWAGRKSEVRLALFNLIKAALAKQLVIAFIIFTSYFFLLVVVLSIAQIWTKSQLKITLFWFFSAGLAGLASSAKVQGGKLCMLEKAKQNFSISVLLDFFVNLYRMPLLAELAFVPFITALTAIVVFSGYDEKHKKVESCSNTLLICIGLLILIYAIYMSAKNLDAVLTINNARELALPIAFSIGILPIIWLGNIYTSYENVFVRLQYLIADRSLHHYTKLALIRAFQADTESLHKWFRDAWSENLDSVKAIDASILKSKN